MQGFRFIASLCGNFQKIASFPQTEGGGSGIMYRIGLRAGGSAPSSCLSLIQDIRMHDGNRNITYMYGKMSG